jgi:predicted peptidase
MRHAAALVLLAAVAVGTPRTTVAQRAGSGRVESGSLTVQDAGTVTFGLYVPRDYDAREPRPLVLALHPGGPQTPDYGPRFLDEVVHPGVAALGAIAIAPNCPAASWTDPGAERAVMALLEQVRREYAIDSHRVLVVGFSMGGRGVWGLTARHPETFSGAIAIAATPGDEPIDRLAPVPTYVIHSRDDEVVEFERSERVARELERLKRPVRFQALDGLGHFEMNQYIEPLRRATDWIEDRWRDAAKVR